PVGRRGSDHAAARPGGRRHRRHDRRRLSGPDPAHPASLGRRPARGSHCRLRARVAVDQPGEPAVRLPGRQGADEGRRHHRLRVAAASLAADPSDQPPPAAGNREARRRAGPALGQVMAQAAHYPSLQDRVVLVTGGATGIGESLVRAFTAQGARVGFIDLAAQAGEALAQQLAGSRHAPRFFAADLTDIAALEAAVAGVRDAFGPIQALMNNAANDTRHSIEATSPEAWDAGIAVNLRHQFFAARAVMADMKQAGGGSIVNLGSVSWMLKQGGMPVYTTSKAAVQGLTRSL